MPRWSPPTGFMAGWRGCSSKALDFKALDFKALDFKALETPRHLKLQDT
jgi:hypothetical protein